jgi:hypothetical protein
MNLPVRQVAIGLTLGAAILFGGWGSVGHRIINGGATVHLPADMASFVAKRTWLIDSSSVPDWRRSGSNGYAADPSEGPKHYLDIDDYPENATRTVPTDLAALIAQYGSARVYDNGILPWAIVWAVDTLTAQMKRGAWARVWSTAADLGHYVGDAHNPLHATVDYNGRASVTGSSGIHSRYETNMVNRFQASVTIAPRTAHYVAQPLAYAFAFIYDANRLVDSIYAADAGARQATGWSGSGSVPAAYLDSLWVRSGGLTVAQFQRATEALADLMYTAWINAGSPQPSVPAGVDREGILPVAFSLRPAYPNPFNPSTILEFTLQQSDRMRVEILSVDGRTVAVLTEGEFSPGVHQTRWDARAFGCASGVYFARLQSRSTGLASIQKLLLLQ